MLPKMGLPLASYITKNTVIHLLYLTYSGNLLCPLVGCDDDTQPAQLVKENTKWIKGCFASLVNKVSLKLNAVNMKEFRTFAANLFPPGDIFTNTESVMEVFNTLTHCRLWDYSDYSTFVAINREFGGGDPELKRWIDNYKAELAGFKATTKIIDHIKGCDSGDEIADSEQSLGQYKARYDKQYCKKLSLKLDTRVTEKSLEYIDQFWRSVADLFVLPPLPVLLESIRIGSTEITWFISLFAAIQIESAILTAASVAFLEKFGVTEVAMDDEILYSTDMDKVYTCIMKE